MDVYITQIKEYIYVFKITSICLSGIDSEYVFDDIIRQVKSWVFERTKNDAATYALAQSEESLTVLALVGDTNCYSKLLDKEVW